MTTVYLSSEINIVAKQIFEDIQVNNVSFKTAFITTGSELMENPKWVEDNRSGLNNAGFETFEYTLTGKTKEDIQNDLADVDIIHVNGGDCYRIVSMAKKSGFDVWIKEAISKGKIYIGSSGGSISTAPDVSNIYRTAKENPMGLNITPVLIVPHWGRADRHSLYLKERLPKIIDKKHKLIMLNDNQYLKITNYDQIEFFDVRD